MSFEGINHSQPKNVEQPAQVPSLVQFNNTLNQNLFNELFTKYKNAKDAPELINGTNKEAYKKYREQFAPVAETASPELQGKIDNQKKTFFKKLRSKFSKQISQVARFRDADTGERTKLSNFVGHLVASLGLMNAVNNSGIDVTKLQGSQFGEVAGNAVEEVSHYLSVHWGNSAAASAIPGQTNYRELQGEIDMSKDIFGNPIPKYDDKGNVTEKQEVATPAPAPKPAPTIKKASKSAPVITQKPSTKAADLNISSPLKPKPIVTEKPKQVTTTDKDSVVKKTTNTPKNTINQETKKFKDDPNKTYSEQLAERRKNREERFSSVYKNQESKNNIDSVVETPAATPKQELTIEQQRRIAAAKSILKRKDAEASAASNNTSEIEGKVTSVVETGGGEKPVETSPTITDNGVVESVNPVVDGKVTSVQPETEAVVDGKVTSVEEPTESKVENKAKSIERVELNGSTINLGSVIDKSNLPGGATTRGEVNGVKLHSGFQDGQLVNFASKDGMYYEIVEDSEIAQSTNESAEIDGTIVGIEEVGSNSNEASSSNTTDLENAKKVIKENLPEGHIAIIPEIKKGYNYINFDKSMSDSELPSSYDVIDKDGDASIYKGVTADGSIVFFGSHKGEYYRLNPDFDMESEGYLKHIPNYKEKLVTTGISPVEVEKARTELSKTAFTSEEWDKVELEEGYQSPAQQTYTDGVKASVSGSVLANGEERRKGRALGWTDGGATFAHDMNMAVTEANETGDKTAVIKTLKNGEQLFKKLSQGQELSAQETDLAVGYRVFTKDVNIHDGLSSEELSRLMAKLSTNEVKSFHQQVSYVTSIRHLLNEDAEKVNLEEGLPLLRRLDRNLNLDGSIFKTEREMEKLSDLAQNIDISSNNVTDNQQDVRLNEYKKLAKKLSPQISALFYDIETLTDVQNKAAERTGADERIVLLEDEEGVKTPVKMNNTGFVESEVNKEHNEGFSIDGGNVAKTLITLLGGGYGGSFGYDQYNNIEISEDAQSSEIMNQLINGQLDKAIKKEESSLLPKAVDKVQEYAPYASMLPYVGFASKLALPAYFNKHTTTLEGGASTELRVMLDKIDQSGANEVTTDDYISLLDAVANGVNEGKSSVQAFSETTGMSIEESKTQLPIFLAQVETNPDAYTQIKGYKPVNASAAQLETIEELRSKIQAATPLQIDVSKSQGLSQQFFDNTFEYSKNQPVFKTVKEAALYDLDQIGFDKKESQELLSKLANTKEGAIIHTEKYGKLTTGRFKAGELTNVTEDGNVLLTNDMGRAVGGTKNQIITRDIVLAPAGAELMALYNEQGELLKDGNGDIIVGHTQCANGVAINLGRAPYFEVTESNTLGGCGMNFCITEQGTNVVSPSVTQNQTYSKSQVKEGTSALFEKGSKSVIKEQIKGLDIASEQALQRDFQTLQNILQETRGMTKAEVSAYMDANNYDGNAEVGGVKTIEYIIQNIENPQSTAEFDRINSHSRIAGIRTTYESETDVDVSVKIDKDTDSQTFHNRTEDDHKIVNTATTVTNTLEKGKVAGGGKIKSQRETYVHTQNILNIQSSYDAFYKAGNLEACGKIVKYVNDVLGVSIETESTTGRVKFMWENQDQDIKQEREVIEKEKPPVEPPKVEPAPNEEVHIDPTTPGSPDAPNTQDPNAPETEEVVNEPAAPAQPPAVETPNQPDNIEGDNIQPAPPAQPPTAPELPEQPEVQPDQVVEGNPTVHAPGNIQPQQPPQIEVDPETPEPPTQIDNSIESNPTVHAPGSIQPSDSEAESGFSGLRGAASGDSTPAFESDTLGGSTDTNIDINTNTDFVDNSADGIEELVEPEGSIEDLVGDAASSIPDQEADRFIEELLDEEASIDFTIPNSPQ